MNVFQLFGEEVKAIVGKPKNIIFMLAVMCIPLLYAGMFLYAFWNAYGMSGHLPVAVVNQDQGTMLDGKHLNAGSDLVSKLKKDNHFDWQFVSNRKANDGFKNNRYFMVVRIPASFSKNATTLVDKTVRPANLYYQINSDYNFVAAKMAGTGLNTLKADVSSQVTKLYAQSMYAQLDKLSRGLNTAAQGSKDLAKGGGQEVAGLNQLKSGFKSLMNGTNQLADGSGQLAGGTAKLNTGLKTAANGTNQLYSQTRSNSDNIAKLADGANSLANNLNRLNKGAVQLANGSGQLAGGSKSLTSGVDQYLAGLNQFQQGMQQEKDGLDRLNSRLAASKPQIDSLTSQMNQLSGGINQVNSGTNQLANGVSQLADQKTGVPQLYSGMIRLQEEVNGLADQLSGTKPENLDQLVSGLKNLTAGIKNMQSQVNDPTTAAALGQLQQKISDDLTKIVQNEASSNGEMISTINSDASLTQTQKDNLSAQIGKIQTTEQQATVSLVKEIGSNLTAISSSLSTQTKNLNSGLNSLSAGLNGVSGQPGLTAGVTELVNGQKQLIAGIVANGTSVTLQSGVNQLAAGITDLRNNVVGVPGQNGMNNGSPSLSLGMQTLQKGTNTLADQVNSSRSIEQMTDQLNELSSAVTQLDSGVTQLSSGSQSLQSNFAKLSDGTHRLIAGMSTLQTNLSKVPGATQALEKGAGQLAAGNSELNQTWPQLVGGMKSLQTGTNQLVSGSNQLATNMNTLNSGVSSLSNGQDQLAGGTNQLASGAQKIYNGNKTLGSNLSGAHSQLAATPTDNAHAAKFSQPVTAIDGTHQSVDTFGSGFAPYFISLAFFIGALILTIIYNLGRPAGLSQNGAAIALSKFFVTILMSIGSSFLIDFTVLKGLGLNVSHPWTFVGFSVLTSATFMAIILFLAGTFGNVGQFIALVILILQLVTSSGAYAVQLIPSLIQPVARILPMTYSVAGFRNIIDGRQQAMLAQNALILAGFLVSALVLSMIGFTVKFHLNNRPPRTSASYRETTAES